MSQQDVLYQWTDEIRNQMPRLSLPTVKTLAAFSFGIAKTKRRNLNLVAKSLPFVGIPSTIERRFQRFVANGKIDRADAFRMLSAWVAARVPKDEPLVLLVDETSLRDRLKAMVVAVAVQGRAAPVAWMCCRQEEWPMGLVEMITALLGYVRDGVGGDRRAIVVADRGIGNSPNLLAAIENLGMLYLMRVTKKVRVMMENGAVAPFDEVRETLGKSWRIKGKAFKKAGWIECWAECVWDCDHEEPWHLVTNCPEVEGRSYGIRMWIELMFRDCKSGGWEWERSRVWTPERADRLWLAMAVAYLAMLLLGTAARKSAKAMRAVAGGASRAMRMSLFALGRDAFIHSLDSESGAARGSPFPAALKTTLKSVV